MNNPSNKVHSKFHSNKVNAKVNDHASNKEYKNVDRIKNRVNVGTGHIDNNKD